MSGDREAVARMIDPKGWATFDRQTASLLRLQATGEPVSPADFDGPQTYVRESLAKADQILAALRVDGGGLSPVQDHAPSVSSPSKGGA